MQNMWCQSAGLDSKDVRPKNADQV